MDRWCPEKQEFRVYGLGSWWEGAMYDDANGFCLFLSGNLL